MTGRGVCLRPGLPAGPDYEQIPSRLPDKHKTTDCPVGRTQRIPSPETRTHIDTHRRTHARTRTLEIWQNIIFYLPWRRWRQEAVVLIPSLSLYRQQITLTSVCGKNIYFPMSGGIVYRLCAQMSPTSEQFTSTFFWVIFLPISEFSYQ